MSSVFLIGIGAAALMIIVFAFFSDDILNAQKEIQTNFIRKRKLNLYRISLSGDAEKEFIKNVKKGFFKRRKEAIEHLIFKAEMKITYGEYFMMCILTAIIGWFIGRFVHNFMISVIMAFIMFFAPKSYLKFVCENIKRQIDEQLETVLSQIIGLLPTKKTLINSVEACLPNMEEPIKTYMTEFINNVNNANRSFEEAINDLARKVDSKPFYDFARLAMVHYKQGGETMYAFNSIPETLRDIKLIQSEQESELDSLRLLGYMFVLLTPFSYIYYYFTDESNFSVLTDSMVGKIISVIALVVIIITVKIIRMISKPVEL